MFWTGLTPLTAGDNNETHRHRHTRTYLTSPAERERIPGAATHRTDRQTDRQTDSQTDRQTDRLMGGGMLLALMQHMYLEAHLMHVYMR